MIKLTFRGVDAGMCSLAFVVGFFAHRAKKPTTDEMGITNSAAWYVSGCNQQRVGVLRIEISRAVIAIHTRNIASGHQNRAVRYGDLGNCGQAPVAADCGIGLGLVVDPDQHFPAQRRRQINSDRWLAIAYDVECVIVFIVDAQPGLIGLPDLQLGWVVSTIVVWLK